jgi:hypothetical protein
MTRERVLPGPAAAAVGERLLGRVEELATELTALIRRAEPFYDKDNLVSADDLRGSVRDNLTYILCRLAGRPTSGLEAARATGRRRAEQGAPLPAILHSYRVAGTAIWATILDDGLAHGADTAALLLAASELWSIMDELLRPRRLLFGNTYVWIGLTLLVLVPVHAPQRLRPPAITLPSQQRVPVEAR